MTMRTCGRVVPFGVAEMEVGTSMFIGSAALASQIARDTQPLECVFGAARGEHAFLGARCLFIPADAGDQAIETAFGEREFQSFCLACRRSRGWRQSRIDSLQRRTGFYPEIELPFLAVAITKRVHLRKFLAGVDV